MRTRAKVALLCLMAGLIAMSAGGCLFRFLGDFLADQFWFSRIGTTVTTA